MCRYQSSCQGTMLMKPRKEQRKLNSTSLLHARPKYMILRLKPSPFGSRQKRISHLQPHSHHSPYTYLSSTHLITISFFLVCLYRDFPVPDRWCVGSEVYPISSTQWSTSAGRLTSFPMLPPAPRMTFSTLFLLNNKTLHGQLVVRQWFLLS